MERLYIHKRLLGLLIVIGVFAQGCSPAEFVGPKMAKVKKTGNRETIIQQPPRSEDPVVDPSQRNPNPSPEDEGNGKGDDIVKGGGNTDPKPNPDGDVLKIIDIRLGDDDEQQVRPLPLPQPIKTPKPIDVVPVPGPAPMPIPKPLPMPTPYPQNPIQEEPIDYSNRCRNQRSYTEFYQVLENGRYVSRPHSTVVCDDKIKLTVYADQPKFNRYVYTLTRKDIHAPSLSNERYHSAAVSLLEEASRRVGYMDTLAVINSPYAGPTERFRLFYRVSPEIGALISNDNIRYIVSSDSCELEVNGPCILLQQSAPYLTAIAVVTQKDGSKEILYDFIDSGFIRDGNILLAADSEGAVLYAKNLERKIRWLPKPPTQQPVPPPVGQVPPPSDGGQTTPPPAAKTGGKMGRCTFSADLDVKRTALIFAVDEGISSKDSKTGKYIPGKLTCRYPNKVDELNVIVTLKGFGVGLNLDFQGNPFSSTQRIAIRGSGIGWVPNVKDMLCKYDSLGFDVSALGLGFGGDLGLPFKDGKFPYSCNKTLGLALSFRAIDNDGFGTSVALKVQELRIQKIDQEF